MTSLLILILSPVLLASPMLLILRRVRGEHRKKSPVSKKVLRYPGYSLSLEIQKLSERFDLCLIFLVVIPAILSASVASQELSSVGVLFWITYLGLIGLMLVLLIRTSSQLIRKRRGLRGEQIVGQQLEKLARYGYFVYHDFPIRYGNIDHVVIGQGGIFVIETKYFRKQDSPEGHIVTVENGGRLHFPTMKTEEPIIQAKRQASDLSEILSKLFDHAPVFPLLVFPGWYVENGNLPDIRIGNGSQIFQFIKDSPTVLSTDQISKIKAYVSEKCCDVEV